MDSFLPPATPQQIVAIYAHLHVTHRALMLTQWRVFFALLGVSLNLLLPWLLLATGSSARLRDRAGCLAARLLRLGFVARVMRRVGELDTRRRRGRRRSRLTQWDAQFERWTRGLRAYREWDPAFFRASVLYSAAYFLFYRVVKLPASLGAYHVEAAYGLTHQSPAAWIGGRSADWMNGIMADTLVAVLVLWLMRFSPRRGPVVLATLFAGSVLVFWWLPTPPNPDLRPLPGGALSQRLYTLAARAGMPQVQILVDETADGRDEVNGYADHSGGTPRILITRKMLNTEPPEQVEATMGHELGHCFYRDGLTTLLLSLAGLFVTLPLLRWLAERLLARFGPRWRITSLADPAALPVLLLSFHLITLVSDPLANAYSRAMERRADAYGIALTRNRVAAAQEYVTFCDQDGEDPDPPTWFILWHDNHPADVERIRFALVGQPARDTPGLSLCRRVYALFISHSGLSSSERRSPGTMLRIGVFAQVSRISIKMLRCYDEIGLLKPALVDDFSGYRYYSLEQLPRAHRIIALKEMGFPLDRVALLLNRKLPPEQLRQMLHQRREELAQQVQED